MPNSLCERCRVHRAVILRPKNHQKLCKACFIEVFETEIHHTITANRLFHRGEKVAIGASGGKDSTVLARVLKTLNERYDYGLDLSLLSIDEGITGYRDDSLETVKRNAVQYDMPLTIVSYGELYGWTMDQVVEQVGKKGNCTYCGVFRRQALDRGAAVLGVQHVVTGHNADDMAETVLMNLLRGDLPRLSRTTSIVTSTPSAATSGSAADITNIKRSKPLKYAYEKEIVLYAHHKNLDYFSTECIYSPEAFRGSARTLIKNLEKVRPSSILDIVKSGEDMARLVPGLEDRCRGTCADSAGPIEESDSGCGSLPGSSSDSEMARMAQRLTESERARTLGLEVDMTLIQPRRSNISQSSREHAQRLLQKNFKKQLIPTQKVGKCERCGYLSSQSVCKACVLLESLNKSRPRTSIEQLEKCEDSSVEGVTVDIRKASVVLE